MMNVIGTLNYLEAARINQVKRFVFASSGTPVGEVIPPITEELAPHPVSPYGASKLAGEGYCSAYYRTYGVETVALRFSNVYGSGSAHKSSVVAQFIKQALLGQPLKNFGDGSQTRDFIYVDDLIDAIRCAAVTTGIGGEIFQIATSREMPIKELASSLLKLLEKFNMAGVNIKFEQNRKGDVHRNFADVSKAKKLLAWQANVDLTQGLERTLSWFTNH